MYLHDVASKLKTFFPDVVVNELPDGPHIVINLEEYKGYKPRIQLNFKGEKPETGVDSFVIQLDGTKYVEGIKESNLERYLKSEGLHYQIIEDPLYDYSGKLVCYQFVPLDRAYHCIVRFTFEVSHNSGEKLLYPYTWSLGESAAADGSQKEPK